MGFALIEQPPQRGKRGRGRGRGRRARDPVKTPGRTREERCLPELLSRLSLGKHAQKLRHLDYAGMKSVDQDDLETLGLDAEAAARLVGASRREVGELLFYKPQGFGFIRPLGETDRKKNIMAHRSAFSHPSVPLRLPPSSLVAYALGSHNGATVAREVRPLDASQAPVLEPDPPAAVVTPPASPPKKEPDVSETTPSAPQIPTVKRNDSFGEIVGPYGYGAWRDDDRDADPVFTPPPPARLSRSSSGQDLRGNPFGTIVAPIGTPSIQPPPPPPPVQSTNAAECPCCLQPGRDTALVPCGHVLCGRCVATYLKRDDADACPVCRAPVLHAMRIFL